MLLVKENGRFGDERRSELRREVVVRTALTAARCIEAMVRREPKKNQKPPASDEVKEMAPEGRLTSGRDGDLTRRTPEGDDAKSGLPSAELQQ